MSVLTVAGQKGGSGKSTLVRNLAIHFALDGYRVGIVDADLIQQHSSEFFADRLKEGGREKWVARTDMPNLTIKVWDRSIPEVPDAEIVPLTASRPRLHRRSHSISHRCSGCRDLRSPRIR